jgi:hypothetical protein
MGQFNPTKTAAMWMIWNAAFHALSAGRVPYLRLTYESFVADPRRALQELTAFSDEALVLSDTQLTDTEVKLGSHHIFSGNPMRTTTGWLPILPDSEWQTQLATAEFAKITAITWPLLRLYGYPTVPAKRRAASSMAAGSRRD